MRGAIEKDVSAWTGMAGPLRLSDRPRTTAGVKAAFTVFRFLVYGVLGVFLEIAFYPLVRFGREIPIVKYLFAFDWSADPRLGLGGPWETPMVTLFGQSSLWMIPVYALPALTIEILYRQWLFKTSLWLRALLYGLVILLFEWATGLAVKALTGYAIWMYTDPGNIMEMTSVLILPIWMIAGILIELIYRELMDPNVRRGLEAELQKLELPPR
jgi:hypothetical protein